VSQQKLILQCKCITPLITHVIIVSSWCNFLLKSTKRLYCNIYIVNEKNQSWDIRWYNTCFNCLFTIIL